MTEFVSSKKNLFHKFSGVSRRHGKPPVSRQGAKHAKVAKAHHPIPRLNPRRGARNSPALDKKRLGVVDFHTDPLFS